MPTNIDFSKTNPFNLGVLGMPQPMIGYRTGYYYQPSFSSGSIATTGAATAGVTYYLPIIIMRASVTISQLTVYVATGGTSSTVNCGLYSSRDGQPYQRLVSTGAVATTTSATTPTATVSGSTYLISNPGLYFLASVSTGSPVATTMRHQMSSTDMFWLSGTDTDGIPPTIWEESVSSLPSTAAATRSSTTNAPCVFIRIA
jgi:hypothetical protein